MSVIGIGGIGKSRLAWEFEKYIDGLAADVWWHRGRCLAYGDGVAFWALAEMVRMRAGILEDEDSESALPKLRATLEENIPDVEERRFVEPRLAQLLGLEARGPGDQENLFSAWRIFFERLADTSPTILLFEDLHWADDALLDFVEYLVDWARDRPIFIVTTARPELLERRPTWGAAKRSFTSLFLEPLPAPQLERLLEGAVTGLPVELRAQILERSEGIPFYAVETVRMLIDRGLLARKGSAYEPTAPIETLDVPSSLQALIAARLDHLSAEERRVLQDASVLGRTFTVSGLQAVSGLGESELRGILDSLRSQGDPLAANRPALPRARPVRLPPGPRPSGGVRHDVEARPAAAAPRGRRLPDRGRPATRTTTSSRSSPPTCSTPTRPSRTPRMRPTFGSAPTRPRSGPGSGPRRSARTSRRSATTSAQQPWSTTRSRRPS